VDKCQCGGDGEIIDCDHTYFAILRVPIAKMSDKTKKMIDEYINLCQQHHHSSIRVISWSNFRFATDYTMTVEGWKRTFICSYNLAYDRYYHQSLWDIYVKVTGCTEKFENVLPEKKDDAYEQEDDGYNPFLDEERHLCRG
jgi:hypothetical protein